MILKAFFKNTFLKYFFSVLFLNIILRTYLENHTEVTVDQ